MIKRLQRIGLWPNTKSDVPLTIGSWLGLCVLVGMIAWAFG